MTEVTDQGSMISKSILLNPKLFALSIVGARLLALSFPAHAQQQARKVPQVGFLSLTSRSSTEGLYTEFLRGLKQLGYIEGKNVTCEPRWADGKPDRLLELAAELVRLKVDVIVVGPMQPAVTAKKATTTIPIVFATVSDPVAFGLVANLARPGGNITGLTSSPGTELNGKRLELLKDIFPKVSRVAVLWNPDNPGSVINVKAIETPAQLLGIKLQSAEIRQPNDLEQAFAEMKRGRAEALYTVNSPLIGDRLTRIVNFAVKDRLPATYFDSRWTEGEGLMSYGPNYADLYRRAATYVDKILKGAKAADLPVEQPTKFEFVINLKTAKQIGVTIPESVLFRADKVIK
jgi:putative tryptophan/tyrosine transport system substrate-binding protein